MNRLLLTLVALIAFAVPAFGADEPAAKYVLIDGKVTKVEQRVTSAEGRIAELEKQVEELKAALAVKTGTPVAKLPNCACGDACPCVNSAAKAVGVPTVQRSLVCDGDSCKWVVTPGSGYTTSSQSCPSGNCGQAQQRWRPGAVLFGRR